MSNPYPSRRELRLQRERAERAKLRDAEIQRWTDEVEQRDTPPAETPDPVLAPAENADDADDTGEEISTATPALGAAAQPVEAAEDDEAPDVPTAGEPSRRRADSEVTSTGMLPIISKPAEENKQPKPRSRREARQLEARRAAQRRTAIERLQREQGEGDEAKVRRRATAPQTTPPPAPAVPEPTAETSPDQSPDVAADDDVLDVEVTGTHDLSATEITDMSGLDTIEIRRAELRAETERLTQEIIELGESNPNVIDPKLLRRQKELAEKSQELQDLETAAIELVESENQDTTEETQDTAAVDPDNSQAPEVTTQTVPGQDDDTSTDEQRAEANSTRGRRRRQTTQGPFITGPFEVSEEDDTASTKPARETKKPPLAEFIRAPIEPEPERDPREPLEASSAHGLDTLDAKDVEAPDRRLLMSAVIMFAIGVIALIVAIILLAR